MSTYNNPYSVARAVLFYDQMRLYAGDYEARIQTECYMRRKDPTADPVAVAITLAEALAERARVRAQYPGDYEMITYTRPPHRMRATFDLMLRRQRLFAGAAGAEILAGIIGAATLAALVLT